MKVMVTGGTGVIGSSTVRALHARGHAVRVLSRHAGRDGEAWPSGVEAWAGDVSNEKSIRGAAEGCDVIVHVAGIVAEHPPARTFQSVNIEGTRYVTLEAERAGVKKLVFVSSLGADRGRSAYHKSKLVAEDVVRGFSRDWVVLRPGAVYGPGDEHLSVLLRMVRSLPIVPTVGDGTREFQPIWHEDFAQAVALSVDRPDVRCVVLDVAGVERTTQNDVLSRLRALTGRPAVQAPLPEILASWGVSALAAIGVDVPFSEAQLDMLTEGNFIPDGQTNSLVTVFGVQPTRLNDGLKRLAAEQPAQLPSEGVGALTRKRWWVDIRTSRYDHESLFGLLRERFAELMPSVVRVAREGDASASLREGDTLTLEIPLRGQVQVRVAEVMDGRLTLLTLAGHPIAGAARFLVTGHTSELRFEVQTYDRPASVVDQIMLRTVGNVLQEATWVGFVQNVVTASGGQPEPMQSSTEELDPHELHVVDEWARALSAQLSRNFTSEGRS